MDLNLISVSYYNIGPFQNKLLNINFKGGNYLIKAPIGSGKSFLFFDGPMYGLYKYSTRNMTNINSEEGFIKLWFSIQDQQYLIIRQLKQGKTKDSCTTTLFQVDTNGDIPKISDQIINPDIDVQEFLAKQPGIQLQEIKFKNETDLQQTLSDLLPPKEVFTSTVFLMQDTDNIFELQPADRLTVLKNVFGLIGIDDAKEAISEKRKEVQTKLKVVSDNTTFDSKLKLYLGNFLNSYKALSEIDFLKESLTNSQDTVQELNNIADKINISDFDISEISEELFEDIHKKIDIQKEQYAKLAHQADTIKKNINDEKTEVIKMGTEKTNLQKQVADIEEKIKHIDPKKLEELKKEKHQKVEEQTKLSQSIDAEKFIDFWKANKDNSLLSEFDKEINENIGLLLAYEFVNHCINQGKVIKEQQVTMENQIENLKHRKDSYTKQLEELELKEGTSAYDLYQKELKNNTQSIKSDIEKINMQIKTLQEKDKTYNEQLTQAEKKIEDFQKDFDSASVFHCTKIDSDCPFITQINKKTISQLEKQQQILLEEKKILVEKIEGENTKVQLDELNKQIKELENNLKKIESNPGDLLKEFIDKIEEKKKIINQEIKDQNFDKQTEELNNKIKISNELLNQTKEFLTQVGHTTIRENYTKYNEIELEKQKLEKQITELENEAKKLEEYKLNKDKLAINIEHIIKLSKEKEIKLAKLEEDLKAKEIEINDTNYPLTEKATQESKILEQNHKNIETLVLDFKNIQLQIKQLKQDEKTLKELHQIFSKELLLIVLEDSLPTLSEIINTFLAQVVEYQINFQLHTTSTGKIELEAKIFDEKGERDVKSLSGGQRVILKLVWMLAISSYLRSSMLFLDETINNLDGDTVGKVADMLSDFVKQNSMKLYTVTHSHQIQDMEIWDDTVEINKLF